MKGLVCLHGTLQDCLLSLVKTVNTVKLHLHNEEAGKENDKLKQYLWMFLEYNASCEKTIRRKREIK